MSEKQEKPDKYSALDEAEFAKDTKRKHHSLRELLDKKLAYHQDEITRLTALRERTPDSVLGMVVSDLTDILRM